MTDHPKSERCFCAVVVLVLRAILYGLYDVCFADHLGYKTRRFMLVAVCALALALQASESKLGMTRKLIESSFVVCFSCILGCIVAQP